MERLLKKLGDLSTLQVCYEAGPTGYVLYWQLTKLGVHCEVIAPSLVPVKAGDRIKTDRRDAEKLARALRAGDLTSVFVPSAEHEALRDLVRAREAAKTDELRAKHRLSKFLLRYGKYPPAGARAWALPYWRWLKTLKLDQPAQNVTLLEYMVEVAHQGARVMRLEQGDDAIASAPKEIRHQPRLSNRQRALQQDLDPRVLEIACKAQLRLSRRYLRLASKSEPAGKVVTAVARELVGFIWAIGSAAEDQLLRNPRKAA